MVSGEGKLTGKRTIIAGGGLWHTDAQPLNLLRRNIDKNPRQIKSILADGELAKEFFGAEASGDERKAVKAFAERNKEDALKTAPKVSTFPLKILAPSRPLVAFPIFLPAVTFFVLFYSIFPLLYAPSCWIGL